MAEILRQYIKNYIISKIKNIPENDPLYNEYQKARETFTEILSKRIVQKIVNENRDIRGLDNLLQEEIISIARETLPYVPNDLETLLSVLTSLEALKYKKKKSETKEESVEDINREYLENVKRRGVLTGTAVASPELKRLYRGSGYIFPFVKTKEELLIVIAAAPPNVIKTRASINAFGWIVGENKEELIKIIKEYAGNPCFLLNYYEELAPTLDLLTSFNIKEMIEKAKIAARNKVNKFNKIWERIEEEVREKNSYISPIYICDKGNVTIHRSWSDVLKLREISNNIVFWYELATQCRSVIAQIMKKKCEEILRTKQEEMEAKNSW